MDNPANVIAILAFAVSIFSLFITVKSQQSWTYSRVMSRVDTINRLLIDRFDVYSSLDQTPPFDDALTGNDKRNILLDMILELFEEMYNQSHHYRILRWALFEESLWTSWARAITSVMQKPYARAYWLTVKSDYDPGLQLTIDRMLRSRAARRMRAGSGALTP